jgi:hypothetical protein
MANIREVSGNAKRQKRSIAGGRQVEERGSIRNLEVGSDLDVSHPSAPVFLSPTLFYTVIIGFEYVAVTPVNLIL